MNDCQCSKLVSVIMPMHNSESYVRVAIDSVLAQTYQKWELIVVDDASTDGTADIIRRYETEYPDIRLQTQRKAKGSNTMYPMEEKVQ